MEQFSRNEKHTEQQLILESDSEEAISCEGDSGHDEDVATAGCDSNVSGSQVHIWLRPKHPSNSGDVHPFTGGLSGLKTQKAPHMNKNSIPTAIFLFFFMKVI
jgi:hypothetical protein